MAKPCALPLLILLLDISDSKKLSTVVSHHLSSPINWDDQSQRVTHRCSGNVTQRADSRLSTGCHCTPCARAPASQTDQRDWGCTSARMGPLELGSSPAHPKALSTQSFQGSKRQKQFGLKVVLSRQWEGEAMFPRRRRLASSPWHWHLCPLLHLQQSSLSPVPPGQRRVLSRKPCWGNYFS